MRKRLLSMLLCMCMMMSLLPVSALAADDGGRPSAADWFNSNKRQPEQEQSQSNEQEEENTSEPTPAMYSEMTQAAPTLQSGKPTEGQFFSFAPDKSDVVSFRLNNEGTLIISGNGPIQKEGKALEYWDTSNGYDAPMSGSGSPFAGNENIKAAVIENGVTDIPEGLFQDCVNLTSVTIANSVTYIGDHAFENCYRLGNIKIPGNVTSIGAYAFANCSTSNLAVSNGDGTSSYTGPASERMTSIVIPDSVTSIGEHVFDGCDELENVTLSKNLTSIADYMFKGCSSLSQIAIPNGVTRIGSYAFSGCPISYCVIPNQVTAIGDYAFSGCLFRTIMIPDGVTSVGNGAFARCGNLTSIEIPNSVTAIGAETFMECVKLTSATISNKIDTIESHTFSGCGSLTSIFIPTSVKAVKYGAFVGCEKLSDVYYAGDETQWKAINFSEAEPEMPNNPTMHWNSIGIGMSNDVQALSGTVEYLAGWDEETRCVYFGNSNGIGYSVDVSAAESAVNSINQLVGKYVLVHRDSKQATTITSIKPVESKIGICSTVGKDMMTIDGVNYPYPARGGLVLDTYAGKDILYHLIEGNIVGASILENKTGTLESWDSTSGQITIDGTVYLTNFLSNISDIEQLIHKQVNYRIFDNGVLSIGVLNEKLTWKIERNILTISGTGMMEDYTIKGNVTTAPWNTFKDQIDTVIIDKNITRIGDCSFWGLENLSRIIFNGNLPQFGEKIVSGSSIGLYPADNQTWNNIPKIRNIIWQKNMFSGNQGRISIENTWGFRNFSQKIPYEYYEQLYGPIASLIITSANGYDDGNSGNCFGFVTGVICSSLNTPSLQSYGKNYSSLCEVSRTDKSSDTSLTAEELIQYGQIFQKSFLITNERKKSTNDLDALYEAVKNYISSDDTPVSIAVYNRDRGHELLALTLEDFTDYSIIGVYDCAFPKVIRKLYLYKTNNRFTKWEYKISADMTWGSEDNDSKICYSVSNSKFHYKRSEIRDILLMSTNSPIVTILSGAKKMHIKGNSCDDSQITPIMDTTLVDKPDTTEQSYLYWINTNGEIQFSDMNAGTDIAIATSDDGIVFGLDNPATVTMDISEQRGRKSVQVKTDENKENHISIVYYTNNTNNIINMVKIDADIGDDFNSIQRGNEIEISGVKSFTLQTEEDKVEQTNLKKDYSYQINLNNNRIDTIKSDTPEELIYSDNAKNGSSYSDTGNFPSHSIRTSSTNGKSNSNDKNISKDNKSSIKGTRLSNETIWSNPFGDIDEKSWYYPAVQYVSKSSLMTGAENNYTFAPKTNLSRAMLAQILYNKESKPTVTESSNFGDVPSGAWYENAVTWAAEEEIVSGYEDGRFAPNDPVTREQFAVMLWRYSGSPSASTENLTFNDTASVRSYALEAMAWAVSNNIISGYEGNWLAPSEYASRVQVAQMLKNYFDK